MPRQAHFLRAANEHFGEKRNSGTKRVPNDLKKKFAEGLSALIGNRAVVDLTEQGGPSRSYIYRMKKGEANPSLEEMDAVLRAYGSSLGEFFAPWSDKERVERQAMAVEARMLLSRILDNDQIDISALVEFLRLRAFAPGERGRKNKRR